MVDQSQFSICVDYFKFSPIIYFFGRKIVELNDKNIDVYFYVFRNYFRFLFKQKLFLLLFVI